jgi:hypothetical protein
MCPNSEKRVHELDADSSRDAQISIPDECAFAGKTCTVRLLLMEDGTITVTKGYAWDGSFLRLMDVTEFVPHRIYYIAVRIWGGLFIHAIRRIRKTAGKRIPLSGRAKHSFFLPAVSKH